jgi:transketolase
MRKQFATTITETMSKDENLCLLLGDIGVFGFKKCFEDYPDRTYNIGILEQSTIGLAAGMSKASLIPVVHTIAPFIVERALEQLKTDFGYQNLNGNFITVGSSYDYASLGSTHHCPADIMVMLSIPNMQIIIPGNSKEFHTLFKTTYNNNSPTYTRLSEYENKKENDIIFGKGNLIKVGKKATIIVFGNMLDSVIDACEDIDVTILYYTTIKPFDKDLLLENFNENIIIIEPFYMGSVNYLITSSLKDFKYKITNIGIPHNFLLNYGSKIEHDEYLQLDVKNLKNRIKNELN